MPTSTNPNRFARYSDSEVVEATEPSTLQSPASPTFSQRAPRYTHLIAEYEKNPGGFPNRVNFTDGNW